MKRPLAILSAAILAATASAADPVTINIKTLQAQMRYDVTEFTVAPGAEVKLILENTDDMPHNLVLFQIGTDVVDVANKNAMNADAALKRDWLPDDPRMIAHSKMVAPKTKDEVVFKAPEKGGEYPFVCTFPGHALSMQGKMRVSLPGPGLTGLKFSLYQGAWKNLPDFSQLKPHRSGDVPDNLIQLKLDDYKNEFGVVYDAKIKAPKDGEYEFFITSDDGSRILIDGQKVVEYDGIHPSGSIKSGKVKLKAGDHDFRLEFFQATGGAELFAAWSGAGFTPTILSKWVPATWGDGAAAKKNKPAPPSMPLTVTDEPVIYRNFIAGVGNRCIAVGYPGGANIAWNAEQGNLVLAWRGAFMDAGKHWTDRGGGAQAPLGFDVFRPAELSPALAVLGSTSEEWPKFSNKDRPSDFAWKGYTLDAKRVPTFHYEWKGVKVAERFEVQGDAVAGDGKLVRTLKLSGKIPANTYLRIANGTSIQPADGAFIVTNARLNLEGRDFENTFRVAADGAQVADKNLLVPARSEIKVTYSWPTNHSQHVHAH